MKSLLAVEHEMLTTEVTKHGIHIDHKTLWCIFCHYESIHKLTYFLAMTDGYSVAPQRILATNITLFSAVICVVILLAGNEIIGFFGITVDEFRVAGGAVLAHIGWSMLNGSTADSHHGTQSEQANIADLSAKSFYPLTFPMIVGPGTIATIIIHTSHASSVGDFISIGLVVGAILALLFGVLFFGKVLTDTMRVIMTRLMGMILLAIAVEMIFAGVKVRLPGLAQ